MDADVLEPNFEYLRFLEMGVKVKCLKMSDNSIAVDTPHDLKKVIQKVKKSEKKSKNNVSPINVLTVHPKVCVKCFEAFQSPSDLKRHENSKICKGLPCKMKHDEHDVINLAFSNREQANLFLKLKATPNMYCYHGDTDDFRCRYLAKHNCSAKYRLREGGGGAG